MIGASGYDAFAASVLNEIKRNRPRPFAAFRGDHRKPMSNRRKIKGAPLAADLRRVHAMSIVPDRASNIAKLQRGLRIIARLKAAAEAEAAPKQAPARGLSDAQLREAVAAKRKHGSDMNAARAVGLSRNAFRNRLKRASERGLS